MQKNNLPRLVATQASCLAFITILAGARPVSVLNPDPQAKIVAVEIYSTGSLAPLPWKNLGSENPFPKLSPEEYKKKIREAIHSLRDGDSLVIGFHSNPRGFADGKTFVEWKDFWKHFEVDPNKIPRLSHVLVAGCQVNYPSFKEFPILSSFMGIPIDQNGVNLIKQSLNADNAFVSKETYWDWGRLSSTVPEAGKIVDWIRDRMENRRTLEELRGLSSQLKYFHFMEDPRRSQSQEGGLLGVGQTQQSWYCTNKPNIQTTFQPNSMAKGGNSLKPDAKQIDQAIRNLVERLRGQGIDTLSLDRFQESLLAGIQDAGSHREVPSFLWPQGVPLPDRDDVEGLRRWKFAAKTSALAWWLKAVSLAASHDDPGSIRASLAGTLQGRRKLLEPLGPTVITALDKAALKTNRSPEPAGPEGAQF